MINKMKNQKIKPRKSKFVDISQAKFKKINSERGHLLNKPDKKEKKYLEGIPLAPLPVLENKVPTYYYYKRWVWLIFPLACMMQKKSCNFSLIMKKSN
jgi:hypothetical protein